jgi:hypothetical protein
VSTQAWTVDVGGAQHRITADTDAENGRTSIRVDGRMAARPVNAEEEEREFPVGSMTYVLRRLPDQTFDLDVAATSGAAISASAGVSTAVERREARDLAKRPRKLAFAAGFVVLVLVGLWWAWHSTVYLRVPWKEWCSRTARVQVEFPGDPAGTEEEGTFTARYREHTYVLQHHDMGAPIPEREASRILTAAVNEAWKGKAIDGLSPTRVSNRDAVQFTVQEPAGGEKPARTIRGVATVHQRYLYLAWAETPPGESQGRDVEHYLHSIRLPFEYAYDAQGQLRLPDLPSILGTKVPAP